MRELYKSKAFVWTLLILFLLVWFWMLGARVLVPTDEGRYAEMAREMVATQDWITTRLNGIKYFEKPPLQTWMNAITFELFGLGEWQARLWTGLCGLLGIGLAAYTGKRVFSARVGYYAALVLASSFFWAGMGHINTLDMGLSGMMTIALCALLMAQRDGASREGQRNWMLLCWAGMALAVLSKGLIGIVLPGAVLVLYTLFARDWAIWKRLHLVKGLLLFFAICTPWFVAVSLRNPEFPQFFFIHEHFQRFTTKIHSRTGPWYYFIPILLLGIIPWLGVFFQSLWKGTREQRDTAGYNSLNGGRFQPKRLLLVWAVFIFVFFSISDSKLPSYVLPIFPALALLIACYLEEADHKALAWAGSLVALPSAVALAFIPRVPELAKDAYSLPLVQAHMPYLYAGALIFFIGGIAAIRLARQNKDGAVTALAATAFLAGQLLILGHEPQGRYSAGVDYVPALQAELKPETPIYLVGRYEQSLPFYLRRTMTLVQHADEMAFGLKQEPQLWLPTVDAFVAQWVADHAAGKKDIAIINPTIYQQLLERKLPMRLIGQDPRRVIVANDPAPDAAEKKAAK
ncbi:glycosyltransferase family 39 protein [Herbaspirillum seropedicae]|uniref:Undecaprenyl-phosphate-4-amino-L-arabinose--lipid A 4-amino-L-arabinosyltransferase protein n=1 Tax=Herbaspirillum seropedicae (strain SmR1) TaxID=757424 RepID=D8IT31_HERSS|nr:glycosyltransferase family 39 protein [Herbaspirillum seropedicae]ADJ63590.1 undecaprenyl-phosphate-4-amino-L-arabinose--lipid A 4-amino-L-arabinosyltransferase protein [Herbaspirillum seropedicae SmR1]AKN65615.1 glycosyltransferase [Herbaspirillum seropedicae]MDR6394537.1 4-amino-4-deoxy-L-arabinose transferase-like glycosyltransferase [Herbaspirillum seropedicae]NQE28774.1 glycosyltransferase [Herbaspirillum seropedicae]UMU21579.1 glycosyltransferase family 39 protein [Herbaspirillum sero